MLTRAIGLERVKRCPDERVARCNLAEEQSPKYETRLGRIAWAEQLQVGERNERAKKEIQA
jgi:hypothetical protein